MVRCFGCLFRWAAADDMIVWSALLSKDHPAGSCSHNGQQAGQETGNRKKKAGHPVHLDRFVKNDITKASLFNEEYLSAGQIYCHSALEPKYISNCVFSLWVSFSVSLASVFSVCLFSPHTDTVFQTAPSSKTSNPTLFSVRIKEEKKHTHSHLNKHQQQPHKTQTKKHKSTNISTRKQTETTHKLECTHAHTHTHLPDTQHILTDKHTKKQQTQSPAQSELYFMQKYSKVCFTIQLNIKG